MDREITIVVSEDEARRIDERVAAGEFASAADLAHAAVANFVTSELDGPISDELVRRLIEEAADDDPETDLDAEQFRSTLHQHVDAVVARRDGKA
jgi:Arc/MetJ-type ribon-helix-helix transcriptional regulator